MNVDKVRSFALAWPEGTEQPHFHSASFRVRGKIFATLPPRGICCKGQGEQAPKI